MALGDSANGRSGVGYRSDSRPVRPTPEGRTRRHLGLRVTARRIWGGGGPYGSDPCYVALEGLWTSHVSARCGVTRCVGRRYHDIAGFRIKRWDAKPLPVVARRARRLVRGS